MKKIGVKAILEKTEGDVRYFSLKGEEGVDGIIFGHLLASEDGVVKAFIEDECRDNRHIKNLTFIELGKVLSKLFPNGKFNLVGVRDNSVLSWVNEYQSRKQKENLAS